jgi:hypothetical protein
MPLKCFVNGCENYYNRNKHCSYHRFPANSEVFKNWACALKESKGISFNWSELPDTSRVCSEHFTPESFSVGKRLTKSAVTTENLRKGVKNDGPPLAKRPQTLDNVNVKYFKN